MNSRFQPFFQHIGKRLPVVHCRIRVGHQHHRCKTAPGRCLRTGMNILLIRKSRIPKMNMNIHQTGSDTLAVQIDRPLDRTLIDRCSLRQNTRNLSVFYQNIPVSFHTRSWIDQIPVLQIQHGILSFLLLSCLFPGGLQQTADLSVICYSIPYPSPYVSADTNIPC